MKYIYLVRHSYTEYSFDKSDIDRAITPEGFNKIDMQIQLLKQAGIKLDLIISSSALRAKQTAQEIKRQLKIGQNILLLDWLYTSYTTLDLQNLFQALPQSIDSVMLIAHNPTISVMATNFNHSRNYQFSPGSILKLEFDIDKWKHLDIRSGKEVYFLE